MSHAPFVVDNTGRIRNAPTEENKARIAEFEARLAKVEEDAKPAIDAALVLAAHTDVSSPLVSARAMLMVFAHGLHGDLRAGDATFHRGWTLHSAPPNRTGALRPVMTILDGRIIGEPGARG